MPMDGLTLGFLVRELTEQLPDGRVEKVYQPEKDMLILGIRTNGKGKKLLLSASPSCPRVHLTEQNYPNPVEAPMFCMLMRKHLTGAKLLDIEQVSSDRVLRLSFENRDELGDVRPKEMYLELMGRHSNLTLVSNGRIIDAIRHVSGDMSRVRQALPGLPFVLPPLQDKLTLSEITPDTLAERFAGCSSTLDKALIDSVRGLSPLTAGELSFRESGIHRQEMNAVDISSASKTLSALFARLPGMVAPVLQYDPQELPVDFYPFPYLSMDTLSQRPAVSLSAAMDILFTGKDRREHMNQRGIALGRIVKNAIERNEKKLAQQQEDLNAAARLEEYRIAGELLTAQAYLVPRGVKRVSLPNFYDPDGGTMDIDLDETLTPAQNAQKYFKRYRKSKAAQKLAQELIDKTERELSVLEQARFDLETAETESDLSDIRETLIKTGIIKPVSGKKKQKTQPAREMLFVSPDGTEIAAGKSSIQNDRLTAHAKGDETWLHAKDMPGSHVIIRSAAPSVETLKTALSIAAWFSKGHGVSVPVDYTLRKFVKKPGGAPDGFVIYTHQHTVLVNATEAEINRIERKNVK